MAIRPFHLSWPQLVEILFREKESWTLNFHNSDPSTLPLMYVHCQKTMPCSSVLAYTSSWTNTGLVWAAPSLLASKLSNQGIFLGTPHPTGGRNPTIIMNPASQLQLSQLWQESESGMAWLEMSTDTLQQTVIRSLKSQSCQSMPLSFQYSSQSLFLPCHCASRRKFKSHPEPLENKIWRSSKNPFLWAFKNKTPDFVLNLLRCTFF